MAATDITIFEDLQQLVAAGEPKRAIAALVDHFESKGQYHELFEALKMQLRFDLGLASAQAEHAEKLDEVTELQLERGLIEACRRVGESFLKEGKIREGWMYMRPVGDRETAANAMAAVVATDDNLDELLEVLVHEGVDIARGYSLALQRLGICNSITLFETALAARPRADQQVAAELLVRHVHAELLDNLRRDIARREGREPSESTAQELLAARPDLLRDGAYHLDTSHLASTVRFGRVLEDRECLQLVLDITAYGRKLHPQYQYPGEEPFLDLYPASSAFYGALLGLQTDSGIRYFTQKADSLNQDDYGTIAVEVLIDLLSRCGKHEQAIEAFAKRIPAGTRTMGIAPTLLQLSQRLGSFESMKEICQSRGDLLGYAAAIVR
ncbi:MAG: hypothetical protein KDB22_01925 [Planctomycetales bacterium]|nr:hypothetical protein [Planctomycetales bacterium]